MLKVGKIYKHINCLDICFRIEFLQENDGGDFFLKGLWLNQHYDMMPICEDEIVVVKDKLNQWREIN
jgi:hypothetical protein